MGPPLDQLHRPLRDLRISVTDRCNNRCPYCMPREAYRHHQFIKKDQRLSFAEILRLTRLFVMMGVRKVRITGGEPLLRTGLPDLIGELVAIPALEDIALTTNGILLAEQARALQAAGLRRVSVSLDSLDPAVFAIMTGGFGHPSEVLAGIEAARSHKLTPIKVNAVIKRGVNDHTAIALAEQFRGTSVILRFIEYMDVGSGADWRPELVVPSGELIERIHARWPLRKVAANYRSEVAERFEYVDGGGELGFISSVTLPVCRDCSRARLTAEGVLFGCLFGTQGLDLRGLLRGGASDGAITARLSDFWSFRDERYSELRGQAEQLGDRLEMHRMGG